jgi:CheY-like chemotaxis protein
MSAPTADEAPKVRVLLVGESSHLFASFQFSLGKAGCECHFAKSHQEMGKLLRHTKPDVVLSLNTCQSLSEMTGLLGGAARKHVPYAAR